jgi:hypothetical protein
MQSKWNLLCLVALAFVSAGCYRTVLNKESTFEVTPGVSREMTIEPARAEQKIKVDVSASAPVSVFVFLAKDQDTVKRDIENRKQPLANVLAREDKVSNKTLEATIPADSEAVVFITYATKATKVTVKLTN